MKLDREAMLLYAVTDRTWVGEQTLYQQVEEALKGGVTCVQLREKELTPEDFLKEAKEIRALCKQYQVPFLINDNVEIAIQCEADGVHVGQSDMRADQVRSLMGEDPIVGVSVKTVEQALRAEDAGADYLGVGAVFSTATKKDASIVTYETLHQICRSVSIPVVAIGGINKENMQRLAGSAVDGVALVSAIFAQESIETECRLLLELSKKMVEA